MNAPCISALLPGHNRTPVDAHQPAVLLEDYNQLFCRGTVADAVRAALIDIRERRRR
jgi:hypothetical protein